MRSIRNIIKNYPFFSIRFNHRHATIHILDNLGHCIYARGLGDCFHEGIVSLMILQLNLDRPIHAMLGGFATNVFLARISAAFKTPVWCSSVSAVCAGYKAHPSLFQQSLQLPCKILPVRLNLIIAGIELLQGFFTPYLLDPS
jgi:hypothetical protein